MSVAQFAASILLAMPTHSHNIQILIIYMLEKGQNGLNRGDFSKGATHKNHPTYPPRRHQYQAPTYFNRLETDLRSCRASFLVHVTHNRISQSSFSSVSPVSLCSILFLQMGICDIAVYSVHFNSLANWRAAMYRGRSEDPLPRTTT